MSQVDWTSKTDQELYRTKSSYWEALSHPVIAPLTDATYRLTLRAIFAIEDELERRGLPIDDPNNSQKELNLK